MKGNERLMADYGHWASALSAERVFAASETVSFVRASPHGAFFLLSMPEEGNAQALMFMSHAGETLRVSPEGINVRSRVQEYGGLPYAFTDTAVYFCNFRDQRVTRQEFDQSQLRPGNSMELTPHSGTKAELRYVDFIVDESRARLICVREDHRSITAEKSEPVTSLVAIDMAAGGAGDILFSGTDFVAAPTLSADGAMLAFQTWSHPNMPWDCTQIRIADVNGDGFLSRERQVIQTKPGSLVQPLFHPLGDLYFIADWSDWWNLYRVEAAALQAGGDVAAVPACTMEAEMCPPQWQLGQRNFAFPDADTAVLAYVEACSWTLAQLDLSSGQLTTRRSGLGTLENISCAGGQAVYNAASAISAMAIERVGFTAEKAAGYATLFACQRSDGLDDAAVSSPVHLSFPTTGGAQAYGLMYPPCNPDYQAPSASLPPLLVLVHGGPTSSARSAFNPAVQFWTSRGFAVLDVNHRGSSGYGRRFRQSLYGEWGVADVADVDAAVRYLVSTRRADPGRVGIRGGSAGGYVVLAALVHSELFHAGACYYGISDLEMLVADTHKFEARYLDQLIGPYPEARDIYRARSPLHHLEQISAAVLLLQGMEDKVVPPNQTQAIEAQLRLLNPATRCLYFADEGHGFRKPANQIAALEAELSFYWSNLL